jgi:hypothetical protein
MCFLHTGVKVIAVTAEHVYAQYIKDKERYSAFSAQVGNATVEPEKYLVARNKELDLATFSLSDILLAATGVAIHYPMQWPPEPIAEREVVLFGGFPGVLREERTATAEFPFGTFASAVTAASPHNITLHLDLPNVHWPLNEKQRLSDLGGASGGPVFRVFERPIDRIELAGFIYEYSPSLDVMFARQGWRVRPDGAIQE